MKTKIKSYSDEATGFHNKEIPKADFDYTCLSAVVTVPALKKDENYYLQVFLKITSTHWKRKKSDQAYYWRHRNFF